MSATAFQRMRRNLAAQEPQEEAATGKKAKSK